MLQHGWGFWALELRATGEFLGMAGLNIPRVALPFMPCVEIGWRLARPFWGQGLAFEAASAALQFGFTQLNLDEIVSFTALSNLRSQALMQRICSRHRMRLAFCCVCHAPACPIFEISLPNMPYFRK